jgi:hypothetical protein
VMSTCVGRSRLPRLQRLARKQSPGANGRPFIQTISSHSTKSAAAAIATHQPQ